MFLDFKNKKLEIVKHEILTPKSDHLIVMLHEGLGSVKMWRDFPETLANKLKIESVPTTVLIREDGSQLKKVGRLSTEELTELILS